MQLIITRKFTPRNSKLSTIQTQMNSMLYLRTLAAVNDLFHFEKILIRALYCLIAVLGNYALIGKLKRVILLLLPLSHIW